MHIRRPCISNPFREATMSPMSSEMPAAEAVPAMQAVKKPCD